MQILLKIALSLGALLLTCACGGDDQPDDVPSPFVEPVPEKTVYTNANLVYAGDDIDSGISDLWLLTLYTDMEIDDTGSPIGPGRMIRISCNVPFAAEQLPNLEFLPGQYHAAASTGDFSAYTFNPGFMQRFNLPTGIVERPDGCFFADIPAGTTEFEADLLLEGNCTVEDGKNGNYAISGILVGTSFLKRYFSYTGPLKVVNRADPKPANTTLTNDVELSLTKARLEDRGDNFVLGDESYRMFECMLSEADTDFGSPWPSSDGRLLRIEFLVPWSTSAAEGIPAGTYTVTFRDEENFGIPRTNIVPGNIVPGYPDQFTMASGTWYQQWNGGRQTEYARITGGTATVERSDGGHRIVVDFTDCGAPAHHIRCTFATTTPIPVYDRNK